MRSRVQLEGPARLRRGSARLCAAAIAWALAGPATAGTVCPAPAGADPALGGAPAEARLAFVRRALDAERRPARAWSWTWGAINGAFTVGQLAAVPLVSGKGDRGLLLAGAGLSAAGVAQVVLLPIAPPAEPREAGGEDPCATLARLEGHLARAARNEAAGTGWGARLGNLLVNAGYGIATGVVQRSWRSGLLSGGLGWAIGEAQIETEPAALVEANATYLRGALDAGGPARAAAAPRAPVTLLPRAGALPGVTLVVAF